METRLQYPVAVDVLAANNNNNNCLDEWTYRSAQIMENTTWTVPTRQGSTGRVPKPNPRDTEIIRKTMLLHEDIFKRQVRELHRLCAVQRMIMEELKIQAKPSQQRDQDENQEAHGSLDLTLRIGLGVTVSTSSTKHKSTCHAKMITWNDNNNKNRAEDNSRSNSGADKGEATMAVSRLVSHRGQAPFVSWCQTNS